MLSWKTDLIQSIPLCWGGKPFQDQMNSTVFYIIQSKPLEKKRQQGQVHVLTVLWSYKPEPNMRILTSSLYWELMICPSLSLNLNTHEDKVKRHLFHEYSIWNILFFMFRVIFFFFYQHKLKTNTTMIYMKWMGNVLSCPPKNYVLMQKKIWFLCYNE